MIIRFAHCKYNIHPAVTFVDFAVEHYTSRANHELRSDVFGGSVALHAVEDLGESPEVFETIARDIHRTKYRDPCICQ